MDPYNLDWPLRTVFNCDENQFIFSGKSYISVIDTGNNFIARSLPLYYNYYLLLCFIYVLLFQLSVIKFDTKIDNCRIMIDCHVHQVNNASGLKTQ